MKRLSGSLDMSVSDTYLLASKARSKLQYEASRNDHDLRILVSHANMLDNIMDSLAQRRRKQQADAILINESQIKSNKPVTFELSKPDRQSLDSHYQVYEDEEEEEYSDEYDDEYEDNYFDDDDDDEEEEEEEDDDDEYDLFQDCQLASNRAYQTNKVQYRSLPTVDELPLDELPDDSQDLQIPQTQLISSLPTSVPIIQVDDQQTLSSSPISEVPSLCYSESDSEKEDDDEVDQVSTLSSQQVQNESQIPIKPIVQPTFKRLLLPSPEQLDMMIH